MDNWILKGAKTLVKENTTVNIASPTQVKVKVSYLLLTEYDALLYSGNESVEYPKTPGRAAVGIVTEAGENCFGLEKGARVYFEPTRACGNCLQCKTGHEKDCTEVLTAGKNFDGFMRDFVVCEYNEVAPLPDSVDDFHALCIETVGIAENIYDKLNLSAGQRVAVIGGDFTGNIIAQVLMYHKIAPIVIDNTPSNLERAKKCGIFYSYTADDDLESNVLSATSGNLCDAAIYCASSRLPLQLAARLVKPGNNLVLCSVSDNSSQLDIRTVMEKKLTVFGVSDAYEYTDAVINMLMHGAVNIDFFEKEVLSEFDPAALLAAKCTETSPDQKGKMTIFKMVL